MPPGLNGEPTAVVTDTKDVTVEMTVPATVDSETTAVGGEMDRQLQALERTEHGYPSSTSGAAVQRLVGVLCVVLLVVVRLPHAPLVGFVVVVGGWQQLVSGGCLGMRDTDGEHTLFVLVLCSGQSTGWRRKTKGGERALHRGDDRCRVCWRSEGDCAACIAASNSDGNDNRHYRRSGNSNGHGLGGGDG